MTIPNAHEALHDLIRPDAVLLNLASETREQALDQLVTTLHLAPEANANVRQIIEVREAKGSTGVGHGVAIPHARSNEVEALAVAYGRATTGIDWGAVDGQLVRHIFLIVAPPIHVSNAYLRVMGDVARLVRDADVRAALSALVTPEEFFAELTSRGF